MCCSKSDYHEKKTNYLILENWPAANNPRAASVQFRIQTPMYPPTPGYFPPLPLAEGATYPGAVSEQQHQSEKERVCSFLTV